MATKLNLAIISLGIFLLLSFAVVDAADLGQGKAKLPAGTLAPELNQINKEIANTELSGIAGKFFSNERINLYVTRRDGGKEVFGIIIENKKVKDIQYGSLDNPSLNAYADEVTLRKILTSKEPLAAFKTALNKKEITYKAAGIGKKIKFGVMFTFAGWFGGFLDKEKPEEARCTSATLYIDSDTQVRDGNGSYDKPFKTIRDAFEFGEQNNCVSIYLEVDKGDYRGEGSLEITRNTRIRGYDRVTKSNDVTREQVKLYDASIINRNSDYELILNHLTFNGGNGVEVYGAYTTILDSAFSNAAGQAIRQTGGRLDLQDSVVTGTTQENKQILMHLRGQLQWVDVLDYDDGAGIYIGGRAEAKLTNVDLLDNANGGLRISDRATKVYASDLVARGNKADREEIVREAGALPGRGAVEARNRATLLLKDATIEDNEYIGLYVLDGAKVHAKDSTARATKGVSEPILRDGRDYSGGTNIIVKQNQQSSAYGIAKLEITNVQSRDAKLVGLQIIDGMFMGNSGNITGNRIGISLSHPNNIHEVDVESCFKDVFDYDNGMDFDFGGSLPLPDASELIESAEGRAAEEQGQCADVEWDCDWC